MAKEHDKDKLDFEEAKELTVQEALRKHKEIEAGVTEEDGVLDRYIKQHRDQVAAEKFETQKSDFDSIDTSSLDSFIQKQKEELANQGLLSKEPAAKESSATDEESTDQAPEKAVSDEADKTEKPAEAKADLPANQESAQTPEAQASETEPETLEEDLEGEETSSKKSKVALFGGLIALLVAIVGGGFALNAWGKQPTTKLTSKASSSASSSQKGSSDYQTFDKLYKSFFLDKDQTQLKNERFSQLSTLQADLKKLEGTSYHKTAKSHYDSLNKQVTAIKTINALFDKAVILDGGLVDDAQAKGDANFDGLKDETLKTGNASLDKLIADAIEKGKAQQAAAKSSASSSSAASAPAASAPESAEASIPSGGNIRQSGITNYNPASLQRDRSRVSYNADAVKDINNSAWTFGDGILEKIVSTSQSRGYFSGNDYILEPVNIINGHGYYNMYKADGTYLFSLNAQTGYFFGNASGRPADY